jgi:4-hydroxy-tetrahydrodipicolinate synthase
MQMLLITLQLGGSGATMPPPAAALAAKIVQAFMAGDMAEAARVQGQFALFPARWMPHGLTPTMKAAMKLIGRGIGDPYPPFPPIGGVDLAQLETFLKTTDLFDQRGDHA